MHKAEPSTQLHWNLWEKPIATIWAYLNPNNYETRRHRTTPDIVEYMMTFKVFSFLSCSLLTNLGGRQSWFSQVGLYWEMEAEIFLKSCLGQQYQGTFHMPCYWAAALAGVPYLSQASSSSRRVQYMSNLPKPNLFLPFPNTALLPSTSIHDTLVECCVI